MNLRLIGAVVAAALAFLGGWSVRALIADADMAVTVQTYRDEMDALARAHEAEREVRIKATAEALAEADKAGRAAAVQYETQIREIATASQKLKTELRNAEAKARAAGTAACPLSTEWVRLYDDALRPGGGASAPSGEPAGQAQGAAAAHAGATPASEWDVAWVHAENAARWAECRAQLNALIDFELGDVGSVVTQESSQ